VPAEPELIDLLDDTGRPTGIRKSKPEVHRDGDLHLAVHIWIVTPDGRILIQRRADTKENYPGLWDVSVAGHVSAGDSAVEAGIREAFEELGLLLEPAEFEHLRTERESCILNGGTYLDNEIHEIYRVRREIDLTRLRLDPAEVADVALVRSFEGRAMVPHVTEFAAL
jgi:isopentenyldiphosphate isomerase